MAEEVHRTKEKLLCALTVNIAQKCVLPWYCHSNSCYRWTSVSIRLEISKVRAFKYHWIVQCYHLQTLLFSVFLITNVATKLLLVITLSHTKKFITGCSMMHQCFVQKVNLSLTFKRGWPHHNSNPTLPGFSRLLVAKCWAQDSCMSHNLTVGT